LVENYFSVNWINAYLASTDVTLEITENRFSKVCSESEFLFIVLSFGTGIFVNALVLDVPSGICVCAIWISFLFLKAATISSLLIIAMQITYNSKDHNNDLPINTLFSCSRDFIEQIYV